MLGELIKKIKKDKNVTSATIARESGINNGHLTHVEKGERMPSHQLLERICGALDVPYQQVFYTYDKLLTDEHKRYGIVNHIAYNYVPAMNKIDDMLLTPASFGTASFALEVPDTSMEPKLRKGSYAFIECNSPLDNGDIGLFYYDNTFVMRSFYIKKSSVFLKPMNSEYSSKRLSFKDDFYIIGKILGTNDDY